MTSSPRPDRSASASVEIVYPHPVLNEEQARPSPRTASPVAARSSSRACPSPPELAVGRGRAGHRRGDGSGRGADRHRPGAPGNDTAAAYQLVAAGDLLGYVGHSGFAVGDHLHLEVLVNGGEYYPVRLLRDRGVELVPGETQ